MNFTELFELLAHTYSVDINDVRIFINTDNDPYYDETIPASPSHMSIAGCSIYKIDIYKDSEWDIISSSVIPIPDYNDYNIHERVILCNLGKGQKYNNEPALIVETNDIQRHFDGYARIFHKSSRYISTITNNKQFVAYWDDQLHEMRKFANNFVEMTYPGSNQIIWGWGNVGDIPNWFKEINTAGDLYKNPLNEKYWNEVTYLDDPKIYRGQNVIYMQGVLAVVFMAGCWIKLDPHWIHSTTCNLPSEIINEIEIIKTLAL